MQGSSPLDNPVWYSLHETHDQFAIHYGFISFYDPTVCPFGGLVDVNGITNALEKYAGLTPGFFIVGDKPRHHPSIELHKELVCNQMVLEDPSAAPIQEEIIHLNSQYKHELFDLVNLVQPGYFRSRTSELGDYFGIYKDSKLVAVTGERMKMNDYTEVSAVVTHPDHTGMGYAKQLIVHTTGRIFDQNKIPYLHVAETNVPAIALYEKLGFRTRRKISFWNFVRPKQ